MAYTAWSVVFGEQPTAAKWNQLGANDAGFKDGTNFDDDILVARHFADDQIPQSASAQITRTISLGYTKNAMANSTNTNGIPTAGFIVPADYISGDIEIYSSLRNTVGSGVVDLQCDVYRFRPGSGATKVVDDATNRTVSNTNVVHQLIATLAEADILAGDAFWVTLSRNGSTGTDTNTGIEDADVAWISYLGRA